MYHQLSCNVWHHLVKDHGYASPWYYLMVVDQAATNSYDTPGMASISPLIWWWWWWYHCTWSGMNFNNNTRQQTLNMSAIHVRPSDAVASDNALVIGGNTMIHINSTIPRVCSSCHHHSTTSSQVRWYHCMWPIKLIIACSHGYIYLRQSPHHSVTEPTLRSMMITVCSVIVAINVMTARAIIGSIIWQRRYLSSSITVSWWW